ncbi:hypothetical protein, partial [Microvirga vignae]|uniref:hypothetical protein n=1 Tax=Microvirga vignae TaxID=1225564 RepID=UPI001AEBE43C
PIRQIQGEFAQSFAAAPRSRKPKIEQYLGPSGRKTPTGGTSQSAFIFGVAIIIVHSRLQYSGR